jgi:hypothetical protein
VDLNKYLEENGYKKGMNKIKEVSAYKTPNNNIREQVGVLCREDASGMGIRCSGVNKPTYFKGELISSEIFMKTNLEICTFERVFNHE